MNRHPTRLLIVASLLLFAGCGAGGSSAAPATRNPTSTSSTPSAATHIVATIEVANPVTVVATPNWLWVLGGPSGVMTQVDPATNQVLQEIRPPHPAGYGTLAFGSLWVVSFMENALMEIDPESGRLIRTIEATSAMPLDGPVGVAATDHDVWVLNHNTSTVLRLNPRTAALKGITRLPGGKASGPMVTGGRLWVSMTQNGLLVRVDPDNGRLSGQPIRVPTGMCVEGAVVGGELWFTSTAVQGFACRDGVSRVDVATGSVTEVPGLAGHGLASFAAAGGTLWADDLGHGLFQVDPDAGTLEQVLTFDGADDQGRLLAAFGSLWATRLANGQLIRIDVG
jgi:streptogramin lyase